MVIKIPFDRSKAEEHTNRDPPIIKKMTGTQTMLVETIKKKKHCNVKDYSSTKPK